MWICEICNHKNPNNEDICEECGSYREETSYDAIADKPWTKLKAEFQEVFESQEPKKTLKTVREEETDKKRIL